jgi:hypothetical protein
MTTPINPATGAPVQRTNADKPKAQQATEKFTIPGESSKGDTVAARGNLSFGSLAPLINTGLNNETAITTAQAIEKQLNQQGLPVVNNRPQVISNLIETLQGDQNK